MAGGVALDLLRGDDAPRTRPDTPGNVTARPRGTGEVFEGQIQTRPSEVISELFGRKSKRRREPGPAFVAYRGTDWMPDPCQSCDRKTKDWGGCRCQAFAWNGDAATVDPAC